MGSQSASHERRQAALPSILRRACRSHGAIVARADVLRVARRGTAGRALQDKLCTAGRRFRRQEWYETHPHSSQCQDKRFKDLMKVTARRRWCCVHIIIGAGEKTCPSDVAALLTWKTTRSLVGPRRPDSELRSFRQAYECRVCNNDGILSPRANGQRASSFAR